MKLDRKEILTALETISVAGEGKNIVTVIAYSGGIHVGADNQSLSKWVRTVGVGELGGYRLSFTEIQADLISTSHAHVTAT